ncbi:carboxypeptidase-like regulatory domain-containing protein [Paraliomyxa miuraensis]|uniref:carboxypeptidase-like regulatory domain-containing protein n=1 Tax=Paraliomyxa miuraensis TaxID=376150 RepID=UPI00224F3D78|nr:carboxypeptidase-like regulatory domain-containing protein [Paraliomyxa miuraensis]MCX4241953.1 carboxypeptidase-like regulatory domain-containing protein [Paraliomyxa miuraensis]
MRALFLASAMLLAGGGSGHHGVISGRVMNSKTDEPIPHALVVLQCACLSGSRETQTNDEGIYAFRGLPAGTYTIQVLAGQADVSKVVTLSPSKPRSP